MRRDWQIMIVLAAVTLAVYWPARHYPFINYDDPVYVTENHHVQAGITASGLAWAFLNLHGEHTYWHPLTWVSHMLDCQLFGLNAGPPHLVNVGLHIANVLVLFLVLRRMTGAYWRSALVAALFALHPLQVDTVAWVTERKNVLSTLFWLLTIWSYVRYTERGGKAEDRKRKIESRKQKAESPEPSGVTHLASGVTHHVSRIPFHVSRCNALTFYALSFLFFTLGLMCKPALVTLPFVLLLLDYWPLRRFRFLPFKVHSPPLDVRCSMLDVGCSASAPSQPLGTSSPTERVSFRRLFLEKLPFLALAAAVSFITIFGHEQIRAEGGMPFSWRLANALVSYVRYLEKALWPSDLAVFYPHPGTWPAWSVAGSALLLLAMSAWVIGRARTAPYLVSGWFWFLGVLVPMIGVIQAGAQAMADRFAYVPLIGVFVMVVWTAAECLGKLRGNAVNPKANVQSPKPVSQSPKSDAENPCLQIVTDHASRLTPHASRIAHRVSGYCFGVAGLVLASFALLTSKQLSFWQNSVSLFEHALRVTRNNDVAHFGLAGVLAEEGRLDAAMREWETALKIDPRRADIHACIAGALARQGDIAGAIARYRRALEIDPHNPEVLNNLAWLLATGPDAAQRDGAEAVRLAKSACELTRFRRTIMVGTLGAAYAEAGRLPEAIETAEKACALAEKEGDNVLLARNRQLLERYRAGKAYHEPPAERTRLEP